MTSAPSWKLRHRVIPLDRPIVFGILNVTPDSFSDGGNFLSVDAATEHARRMLDAGADALDIGGESTRPQGATPVAAPDELKRVLPVLAAVRAAHPDLVLSVDTVKSEVARAALAEGASIVNDVSAFRLDPNMAHVCASAGAGVILMHSRGTVRDMGTYAHATYDRDVMDTVIAELREPVRRAREAGVATDAIVLDPGIGFAKRSEHSLAVLHALPRLVTVGFPVMIGASRKRFIGELTEVSDPTERVEGTIAANVLALAAGARLFRVHDVTAARRSLDVAWAILSRSAVT